MIVIEQHLGHWTAWFEDHPEAGYGGDSPRTAASLLLAAHGHETASLVMATPQILPRMVFHEEIHRCTECGGSGKYTGLFAVEDCKSCVGTGSRIILAICTTPPEKSFDDPNDDFDVEAFIASYRRVKTRLREQPELAAVAGKLRAVWKAWQGEDSLDEMATEE